MVLSAIFFKIRPDCGANTEVVPTLCTFFSRFVNSRFSELLAIVGKATPSAVQEITWRGCQGVSFLRWTVADGGQQFRRQWDGCARVLHCGQLFFLAAGAGWAPCPSRIQLQPIPLWRRPGPLIKPHPNRMPPHEVFEKNPNKRPLPE